MRRISLAALLGISLGLGLAFVTGSTASHERALTETPAAEAQLKLGAGQVAGWYNLQPALLGLMVGVLLGILFFLMARRWER
jgi:ABC-type nitrate/sulfonate/bicarbonate transport system permease component